MDEQTNEPMEKRIKMDKANEIADRLENGEEIVVMVECMNGKRIIHGQVKTVFMHRGLNESRNMLLVRVWREAEYLTEEEFRAIGSDEWYPNCDPVPANQMGSAFKDRYYVRPPEEELLSMTIIPNQVVELKKVPLKRLIKDPYTKEVKEVEGMYLWSECTHCPDDFFN
jgi:hypothetical protein